MPAAPRPVAVVAHGSGSTADFVARAFAEPLTRAGVDLVAFDDRSGDVEVVADRLAALVDDRGASLVGGVSLGAHAAVRVAATRPWLTGALLVLPAWTGPAGAVAALSARAATEVAEHGVDSVLGPLADQGWVGAELARAWPTYPLEVLVAALLATARSPGPGRAELARLTVATSLVAVTGDPYHPVQVARSWAALLPAATLTVLDRVTGARDLGDAAVAGWIRARTGSPSPAR